MTEWKQQLGDFLGSGGDTTRKTQNDSSGVLAFAAFVNSNAVPAFNEIASELSKYGRETNIRSSESSATLMVYCDGEEEISYRIHGRTFPTAVLPCAEIRYRERKGLRYIKTQTMIRSGPPVYKLADIKCDEIVRHFLEQYMRHVHPAA